MSTMAFSVPVMRKTRERDDTTCEPRPKEHL